MPTLNLSEGEIGKLIQSAVIMHLSPEIREKLITEAIENLFDMNTQRDYHGKKVSIFEQQFNYAVTQVASEEIKRIIESDVGFMERIHNMIQEAFKKTFEDGDVRDRMVKNMTKAIESGLKLKDVY